VEMDKMMESDVSSGRHAQRNVKMLEDNSQVGFPVRNRSSFLKFSESGPAHAPVYNFSGHEGYRTALTGHGVKSGHYYFEVTVGRPEGVIPYPNVVPAVRVGLTCFNE